MRLGVADGGLRHHHVAFRQIQIPECGVLHGLRGFRCLDRSRLALHQRLPPLADPLCIVIISLRFLHAGIRLLQIGFGLLDRRPGAGRARPLLAVVKAGENGALGDVVADIGSQIDQHAGNLEADFGCDARLDRAETENLNRHVALDLRDLDIDRPRNTESKPPHRRRRPTRAQWRSKGDVGGSSVSTPSQRPRCIGALHLDHMAGHELNIRWGQCDMIEII